MGVRAKFITHFIEFRIFKPFCIKDFKKYFIDNYCIHCSSGVPLESIFAFEVLGIYATPMKLELVLGVSVYIEYSDYVVFETKESIRYLNYKHHKISYSFYDTRELALNFMAKSYFISDVQFPFLSFISTIPIHEILSCKSGGIRFPYYYLHTSP